ncbi:hypothetical protein [Bradyrhizobium zhanjiangense]|uniref:hypothetical protein n=1 Tax=Bradyrhizobium zhanjiangense TaxID=1325107 RepID=UPI0013E8EA9E|nr:hypothetical protein [Bradyrhizobium zhanjiangense]
MVMLDLGAKTPPMIELRLDRPEGLEHSRARATQCLDESVGGQNDASTSSEAWFPVVPNRNSGTSSHRWPIARSHCVPLLECFAQYEEQSRLPANWGALGNQTMPSESLKNVASQAGERKQ